VQALTVVLIDGRNVQRSRWPNVPGDELVQRCATWAQAHGLHALVIFDGTAPGELLGEHARDASCGVVGTGRESADDWIARRARELAGSQTPYWLVTSDRELRARAGQNAERCIGGGSFLPQIGAAARPRD
jgi:predicted RNA-binding protein with PIN domain